MGYLEEDSPTYTRRLLELANFAFSVQKSI